MGDGKDSVNSAAPAHRPGEAWGASLRQVCPPLPLIVLALRTLGVTETLLGQIFKLSEAQLWSLLWEGQDLGQESALHPGLRYDHDLAPIGLSELERLIARGSSPCQVDALRFEEGDALILQQVVDGEEVKYITDPLPHRRLQLCEQAEAWLAQIRHLFLKPEGQIELILLLPQSSPAGESGRWQLIRRGAMEDDAEQAMRLLAGLSVLGLSHRASGHRSGVLPDLVVSAQALFKHFAVCGAPIDDRPDDETLRQQMRYLASGVLLQRPPTGGQQSPESVVRPLAIDFSSAWADRADRFADYLVRDRRADADEFADALLWLMAKTAGVCLHLSLAPRLGKPAKHDIRLLAPQPWIDFCRQGLGANRGKDAGFAPYQGKQADVPLLWVDEPPRYEALKKGGKRGYQQRKKAEKVSED